MNIQSTLDNYKSLGEYFAPDYEQENEVLNNFKASHPSLSKDQTTQLVDILTSNGQIENKYFVADLLYLYDNFDIELLDPMLLTAINYGDPSFNRIFLRPCLKVFGTKQIADILADKFKKGDILQRIGISKLVYWLEPQENGEADSLHQAIIDKANSTDSLIELYHYKLIYSDKIKQISEVPSSASELIKAIQGNKEYEDLLFNKLRWVNRINN